MQTARAADQVGFRLPTETAARRACVRRDGHLEPAQHLKIAAAQNGCPQRMYVMAYGHRERESPSARWTEGP
ncbi:hypothetical protein [Streptomyces sp. Ac-502]|uniref:hypothetical protein n=1 Tax=Streptomyces sp. Ac-502 TaxID=3342801 RepID=UPI003862C67F